MNPSVVVRRRALASAVAISGLAALALPASVIAAPIPTVFGYTGAEQVYAVPAGVHRVQVTAVGAPGGLSSYRPSIRTSVGALVTGQFAVDPGQLLYVAVGGQGTETEPIDAVWGSRPGGWNGGGAGMSGNGASGSGGGGASDVRTLGRSAVGTLAAREIVAGGGGGLGAVHDGDGGFGGNGGEAGGEGGPGTDPTAVGGYGGQPGGDGVGGAGGLGRAGTPGAGGSASGQDGTADAGGIGSVHRTAGGGGGGGYGGGGGGGGGIQVVSNSQGSGGGGGGGGSLVPEGGTVGLPPIGTAASVTITAAVPSVAPISPVSFAGTQPQGIMGPGQTVTIVNDGLAPLHVGGLEFVTGDVDDFAVTSSTCGAAVAPGASCRVVVRFVPQALGARASKLEVLSDSADGSVFVDLSGTGGELPTGPTGATGQTGATGGIGASGPVGDTGPLGPVGPIGNTGAVGAPGAKGDVGAAGAAGQNGANGAAGAAGAQGPAGPATVYECRNVKAKGKKKTKLKCTVVVKTAKNARISVSVTRGGRLYATATTRGTGRSQRVALLPTGSTASRGRYAIRVTVRSAAGKLIARSTGAYTG